MASKQKYKCISCGYECDNYDGRGFFGQIALPRLTGESEGVTPWSYVCIAILFSH